MKDLARAILALHKASLASLLTGYGQSIEALADSQEWEYESEDDDPDPPEKEPMAPVEVVEGIPDAVAAPAEARPPKRAKRAASLVPPLGPEKAKPGA